MAANRSISPFQAVKRDRLMSVLSYDSDTGIFRWRVALSKRVRVGEEAGRLNNGYIQIAIDGQAYQRSRLAWFYVTGEWPPEYMDHANGNRTDDRFDNLRCASPLQNSRNCKKPKTNTSGFKGVYLNPNTGRYRSCISVFGRSIHLGTFDTPEEASAAYGVAAALHFGEFNRDR